MRGCGSRRTMGQFVQSEEKAEKESDRGRVKPPRVWWWLETSLTQTMRRRMTTSSAWRVCLWRLSSHNEMALWIILTPQTCAHNDTHKQHLNAHMHGKRFHFTFSSPMTYKVCSYRRWRGDAGSLCRRGICLVCQSIHKHSKQRHKSRCWSLWIRNMSTCVTEKHCLKEVRSLCSSPSLSPSSPTLSVFLAQT